MKNKNGSIIKIAGFHFITEKESARRESIDNQEISYFHFSSHKDYEEGEQVDPAYEKQYGIPYKLRTIDLSSTVYMTYDVLTQTVEIVKTDKGGVDILRSGYIVDLETYNKVVEYYDIRKTIKQKYKKFMKKDIKKLKSIYKS